MSEDHAREATAPTPSEVVDAAEAELAATKASPATKDIGAATAVDGHHRRFRVANPAIDLSAQPAGELFLSAPQADRIPVHELIFASHAEVVVEVSREPQGGPFRLSRKFDASFVAKAFVDYLSKTPQNVMAASLFSGALTAGAPAKHEGFNDLQQAAVGTVIEPGLSVVWGPPGTGKTRVIGAAVERLLADGCTVAIVSNTNIAVDQALLRAEAAVHPVEPGVFVRVGHASSPKILEHPSLTVSKAAAAKSKDLAERLDELEARVADNLQAKDRTALTLLREQISDHDLKSMTALVSLKNQLARRPLLLSELASADLESEAPRV